MIELTKRFNLVSYISSGDHNVTVLVDGVICHCYMIFVCGSIKQVEAVSKYDMI